MKIINKKSEMQAIALSLKKNGKKTALVPTMGFLHEGHASLLREGRKQADVLLLSIFVNPIQFGQNEDLDQYPRNLEQDCRIAAENGVDYIFAPTAAEMYPAGFQTMVATGKLSLPLCGASRPGHFDGVATVVTKLFNIVMPDVALFGYKDYQQLAIIRQMTADLDLPVNLIGMPIIREPDGLAMSSRNSYLSTDERERALCISRAINKVRELYKAGERTVDALCNAAKLIIEPHVTSIDYLEFRNSKTLEQIEEAADGTLMAIAVKIGKTRLIDNTLLGEEL